LKITYGDQKECLEAMGRLLAENVPAAWVWIRSTGEIDGPMSILENSYQPTDADSEPVTFFIEDGERDMELADCYQQLARLLNTGGVGLFKKCHYSLNRDGKYRAEYEY